MPYSPQAALPPACGYENTTLRVIRITDFDAVALNKKKCKNGCGKIRLKRLYHDNTNIY
jgi:hypothetical protein